MNGKKIKTIVAIILVLFVIIGCALAYAYVQTDIFKTPEQLFSDFYLHHKGNTLHEEGTQLIQKIIHQVREEI